MKNILKRILSKIIDAVLFLIFSVAVVVIFLLIFNMFFSDLNIGGTSFSSLFTESGKDGSILIETLVQENEFLVSNIANFISLVLGFIYFGLIGKITHGSLGKYAVGLYVAGERNKKSIFLFLREPLMHILLISWFVLYVSNYLPFLSFLEDVTTYLFMILLVLKKDYWNRIFNFSVN